MADTDVRDYLKETLARFIEQEPVPIDAFDRLDRIEYRVRRDQLREEWDAVREKMSACDLETPEGSQRWMELNEEWERIWNQIQQLEEDYGRR